jgi:membrane-associated phospholipid phosphatase
MSARLRIMRFQALREHIPDQLSWAQFGQRMDTTTAFSRRRGSIWKLIAVLAVTVALIYVATGLSIAFGGARSIGLLGCLLAVAWFYRVIRPDRRISSACETAVQLILITALFTLLGFGVAVLGAGVPYRDATLAGWDAALGCHWLSYLAFAEAHPRIQSVLQVFYVLIPHQYVMVLLFLSFTDQRKRLDRFIIAMFLSLAATMAIFLFMPATAAFRHFGVTLADLHGWQPVFLVNRFIPLLFEMRSAGPHIVRLDDLEGLVTFPSFHAEAALLFAWATWRTPWIKWPVVAANIAMVLATPVEGGHYFVDIAAGFAIASLAIRLSALPTRPNHTHTKAGLQPTTSHPTGGPP